MMTSTASPLSYDVTPRVPQKFNGILVINKEYNPQSNDERVLLCVHERGGGALKKELKN